MEARLDSGLRDLVERAAGGDVHAFRELFDRYSERVHRYAVLRLGELGEAEDAVQDVFLAIWRGLPRFRYEHDGSFPGWMFGIARNVVASRQRRAFRVRLVSIDEAPDEYLEFEEGSVLRGAIAKAMGRLPENQREVLLLRFVAGLRAREVAESLGRSEAAVVALQARALDRLRRELGDLT